MKKGLRRSNALISMLLVLSLVITMLLSSVTVMAAEVDETDVIMQAEEQQTDPEDITGEEADEEQAEPQEPETSEEEIPEEQVETKTVAISTDDIVLENQAEDLTYEIKEDAVEITVEGSEAALDTIADQDSDGLAELPSTVTLTLDVSAITEETDGATASLLMETEEDLSLAEPILMTITASGDAKKAPLKAPEKQNGFVADPETGAVYCYRDGEKVSGLQQNEEDGLYYYFDSITFEMVYDKQVKIDGQWYYFLPDTGVMATSTWITFSDYNKTVYYKEDGTMAKGQVKVDGSWYYFDEKTGARVSGWKYWSNGAKWVYYGTDGKMTYGQKKIGGYWYYFDTRTGKMTTGWKYLSQGKKWVYYNSQGRMLYGQQKIGGSWYYLNEKTGARYTGWKQWTQYKKWVYYKSNGVMATGRYKVGNYWYYFNEKNGARMSGWKYWTDLKRQVYYNSNGTLALGDKKIGDYWYYFNPKTGEMTTGWVKVSGVWYYYDSSGHMVTGLQKIDGTYYEFHGSNGSLLATYSNMDGIAQSYSSSTPYLILVDKSAHMIGIYYGSYGNWTQIKSFPCSIGAAGTPTPSGDFSIINRKPYFDPGGGERCWYATRFYGAYLFHSVIYHLDSAPNNVMDGRMRENVSHGCIRMYLEDCYWIYTNIPNATRVIVY